MGVRSSLAGGNSHGNALWVLEGLAKESKKVGKVRPQLLGNGLNEGAKEVQSHLPVGRVLVIAAGVQEV